MSKNESNELLRKLKPKKSRASAISSEVSRQRLVKVLSVQQEKKVLDELTRIVDQYGITASNWHVISDQIDDYIANNATTKKEE